MVKVDSSSHARVVVTACIVLPILASAFMVLRIWTRHFVSHSLGRDDYTAMITLLFCITYSILIGLSTNRSILSEDTAEGLSDYVHWIQIADIIYLMSLVGYKMAILLIYLRLFGVNKRFKYFTWVLMFFVCGYVFSNFWTQLFGCSPPSKYWLPETPGHCMNYTKAGLAYGSMNISSDFFIFVLPLPMIWGLRLSRREKIGVSLIFMSGAITCAVAIVRYYYVVRNNAADARYFVWSVMEINIGLICSCTTSLKPFFTHVKSQITQRGLRGICGVDPGGPAKQTETTIHGLGSIVEMGRYRSVETTDHFNVTTLSGGSRMAEETRGVDLSQWDQFR